MNGDDSSELGHVRPVVLRTRAHASMREILKCTGLGMSCVHRDPSGDDI